MEVIKRDGARVKFIASKVQTRVVKTAKGLKVDADVILLDVFKSISDSILASDIDNLISEISAGYITKHPDYSIFASRILESRLNKDVPPFFEASEMLYNDGIISEEQYNKYKKFSKVIQEELENTTQPILDYLGIRTFTEVYATKCKNNKILETPKYFRIRLATFFSENSNEFKENIEALKSGYSPPTPTMCNAGTTENQLASCQLHYLKEDSTDGLMDTFKDLAHSSRNKAGIGLAAYNQRAKGSKSSKGWGAAGQVKAMKIVNEIMGFFDQGGKRPGSTAWYSTPWHADIFDFLKARKVTTHESIAARDMFYALWVDDEFMKRVEAKDKWYLFCPNELKKVGLDFINKWGDDFSAEYLTAIDLFEKGKLKGEKILAEDLWKEIYVTQVETGMPYMLFKDTVNKMNSQSNLGTIKSSNLCVAGDTKILTDFGYKNIEDLEGKFVNIWNGEEYSEVEIFKTGENADIMKVSLSDGGELKATPYHKWYRIIRDENNKYKGKSEECTTNELKPGDELIKSNPFYTCTHGHEILKNAWESQILSEYVIPSIEYTIKSRLDWLSGLIDSDGCLINGGVLINSANKKFVNSLKLYFQELGVESVSSICTKVNRKSLGGLRIPQESLNKLIDLGLSTKKIKLQKRELSRKPSTTFTKVVSVENLLEKIPTYCFTEPKRHMGMFNGILTGQCGEIVQYTDPETVAVCVLSSLVVSHFVGDNGDILCDKLEKYLNLIVRNLNISIDKNKYTTKEAEKGALQQRAIGVGIQGLSDVFFKLNIAYDSPEALELISKLQEAIHYYTIKGSMNYSKKVGKRLFTEKTIYPIETGEFQWQKYDAQTTLDWESLRKDILKYGVANSMTNAQMPTASSAQMHGSTESFETLTNNIYSRRLKVGEITVINKHLVKDFEKLGIWNDELSDDLILAGGSVQDLNIYDYVDIPSKKEKEDFLTIQNVYKTSWEVSQKARTNVCIAMQPFIDQAISMNVFYKEPTIGKWSSGLFYAWRNRLKTGNYYCRTFKDTGNKSLGISKKEKLAEMITKSKNSDPQDCDMCSS